MQIRRNRQITRDSLGEIIVEQYEDAVQTLQQNNNNNKLYNKTTTTTNSTTKQQQQQTLQQNNNNNNKLYNKTTTAVAKVCNTCGKSLLEVCKINSYNFL